ncbi:Kelch repeat-containing protein [Polyangium aurulentum]|uniref:Kelch repeat-containing protein n=1 Tax=Polyangium aurulentum TaxID=2567896 RepID=UPI00146A82C4|nr:kelch repeat-containing protein [Polyangium aurulentum]UQA55188.1 hypothetical protein E8A73_028020 [Polyangium aurulentum]
MHRKLFPHSIASVLLGSLAAVGAVAATIAGCSEDDPAQPSPAAAPPELAEPLAPAPIADSLEARARLDALRAVFPKALAPAPGAHFERAPGGHVRLAQSHRAPATLGLPASADAPVRLMDAASGLAVSFSLVGAAPSSIATDRGIALYRAAAPTGGDLIHRPGPDGTEDLVLFESAPAEHALRYGLDLPAASGLRLVSNTLEILDAGGVPRLRVAPPFVLDASGARRTATLAVEGCAVDTSPRAPWLHPVPPPGAERCTVAVRWSSKDLRYPVLVDPVWQTTASMVHARVRPVVAEMKPAASSTHLLLVTGGFDGGGNALPHTEIYFPLERVFAAGPDMAVARGAHTATNLKEDATGKVLIAGGATKAAPASADVHGSLVIYDPETGELSLAGQMTRRRLDHTATLVSDGKVLIAGGTATDGAITPQPSNLAEVFDEVAGSTTDVGGGMKVARTAGAAVRLATGQVMITGGFGAADFALSSTDLYNAATDTFSQGPQMGAARARHTATLLADGRVLITGGTNAAKAPAKYWNTADIYTPGGGFGAVIPMKAARARHSATLLPTGEVVLAGGIDATDAQNPITRATTEIFNPIALSFAEGATMTDGNPNGPVDVPRRDHAAALVLAGKAVSAGKGALVLGGAGATGTALDDAKILIKDLGDPCKKDDECLSGHCAEPDATGTGVCCDQACDGVCRACRAVTKQQPDVGPESPSGVCGFAKANTELGWKCVYAPGNDIPVEILQVCDGKGNPIAQQGKSCVANGCDQDKEHCSTDCPCNDAGFCTELDEDGGPTVPHCEVRMDNGQKCTEGPQCASGNCVDGFCCDTKCEGQCEACNVQDYEGKCQPAGLLGNTAPVGGRAACTGSEGSPCKGFCDNNDRGACTYPGPTTTDFTECKCEELGACTQTNHLCDAKGGSAPEAVSCAGYGCSEAKCNTSCVVDTDCREDSYCENGGCKLLPPEGRCDGDHTIRVPKKKDTDCGAFKCAGAACLAQCASVDQCVAPNVCTLKGECIPPPPAPVLSSCSTSPGRTAAEGGFALLAALASLAGVARRARARGDSSRP